MICVFLGFVLSDDPTMKMFGLGLATAIFVDATIVRLVLVPAAMTLLGERNWWLPRRLQWLPDVQVEGSASKAASADTAHDDPRKLEPALRVGA